MEDNQIHNVREQKALHQFNSKQKGIKQRSQFRTTVQHSKRLETTKPRVSQEMRSHFKSLDTLRPPICPDTFLYLWSGESNECTDLYVISSNWLI